MEAGAFVAGEFLGSHSAASAAHRADDEKIHERYSNMRLRADDIGVVAVEKREALRHE